MKKTYILLIAFFTVLAAQAQVDRTVMPKPGPAPEINLSNPESFQLNNGLKVMVVENHKLPRVSIQLTIDNPPILEGDKAGVSSLTGSLLGNGSTNLAKDEFNEERLVFHFGEKIKTVENKLYSRDLILDYDKTLSYVTK